MPFKKINAEEELQKRLNNDEELKEAYEKVKKDFEGRENVCNEDAVK